MRSSQPIKGLVFLIELLLQKLHHPTDTSGQGCPCAVANMATMRKKVSLSRAHGVVSTINMNNFAGC